MTKQMNLKFIDHEIIETWNMLSNKHETTNKKFLYGEEKPFSQHINDLGLISGISIITNPQHCTNIQFYEIAVLIPMIQQFITELISIRHSITESILQDFHQIIEQYFFQRLKATFKPQPIVKLNQRHWEYLSTLPPQERDREEFLNIVQIISTLKSLSLVKLIQIDDYQKEILNWKVDQPSLFSVIYINTKTPISLTEANDINQIFITHREYCETVISLGKLTLQHVKTYGVDTTLQQMIDSITKWTEPLPINQTIKPSCAILGILNCLLSPSTIIKTLQLQVTHSEQCKYHQQYRYVNIYNAKEELSNLCFSNEDTTEVLHKSDTNTEEWIVPSSPHIRSIKAKCKITLPTLNDIPLHNIHKCYSNTDVTSITVSIESKCKLVAKTASNIRDQIVIDYLKDNELTIDTFLHDTIYLLEETTHNYSKIMSQHIINKLNDLSSTLNSYLRVYNQGLNLK
jgi:hypothetical protein